MVEANCLTCNFLNACRELKRAYNKKELENFCPILYLMDKAIREILEDLEKT